MSAGAKPIHDPAFLPPAARAAFAHVVQAVRERISGMCENEPEELLERAAHDVLLGGETQGELADSLMYVVDDVCDLCLARAAEKLMQGDDRQREAALAFIRRYLLASRLGVGPRIHRPDWLAMRLMRLLVPPPPEGCEGCRFLEATRPSLLHGREPFCRFRRSCTRSPYGSEDDYWTPTARAVRDALEDVEVELAVFGTV